jgi:NAD(P)H-flavin reductase
MQGLVGDVAARAEAAADSDVLICGSPDMVRHTVRQLHAAGVPPERTSSDQFAAR